MNYCSNCGNKVDRGAYVCPKCGVLLKKNQVSSSNDTGSIGYGILGYFIPLVGLILYLCWRDEKPNNAKVAGKGALISVIVNAILCIFAFIIIFTFIFNADSTINNGFNYNDDYNLKFD